MSEQTDAELWEQVDSCLSFLSDLAYIHSTSTGKQRAHNAKLALAQLRERCEAKCPICGKPECEHDVIVQCPIRTPLDCPHCGKRIREATDA